MKCFFNFIHSNILNITMLKNQKYTTFSILEKIEKIKIDKNLIKIKNLHAQQKQSIQQLKLLNNYKKEYINTIKNKILSGIYMYEWKNYNSFILILNKIIKNNEEIINQNKKNIKKYLNQWSKNLDQIKIWQILQNKNQKEILKLKITLEQLSNDHFLQFNLLKKG